MATSATIVGLHCGDRVRLCYDPRHVGTVIAVIGVTVRVRWDSTTWISDEDHRDVQREES